LATFLKYIFLLWNKARYLDFRGRIYNRVTYLNYQGTELAKALLLFANPVTIQRSDYTSIDYLKAYAATCYGCGLGKKSYNDRLAWVKINIDKIINLDKELIKYSENPYKFITICIELKILVKFLNNPNLSYFYSYLLLQLDGSCKGFQHLSLLSEEVSLFKNLNLYESNKDSTPEDFYSFILEKVNNHIVNELLSKK
jgi:DNA-directed RNA polymerase